MMRVDRNDIWYNIQQIAQQYEQFLTIQGDAGSSYPDYRHFAIGLSAEEELLMREQEEREKERRERNYQKLVSFRQGSVNNALNYFLENMGDINAIYKNAIIPFENTDDDYASLAEFYYDMWATTGDNWTDFLRSSGDICRGLGDATVDMLDGIASLGAFAIYESVPAGCSANGDLAFLPDCITERALGTGAAIEMLIKEPGIVVDCMGQNMMDTYEEEGLAYATGYVTLDVVVEILTTKGMRSVKGALRTTDATSDVMNTVATTERVADDILDVAEENSKIQEILRNKRVSDAYPELDELEKFYDDIYEQQRNICQEYEDYLDELRKLQSEPDIVPEGNADVVEEVAESALEGGTSALPNAEDLKMSQTVQNHMNDVIKKGSNAGQLSRPYIDSDGTTLLLKEIMESADPVPDTILQSGLRWDVSGTFRGSTGTWELVVDTSTNTVVHFNFVAQ